MDQFFRNFYAQNLSKIMLLIIKNILKQHKWNIQDIPNSRVDIYLLSSVPL